MNINEIIESGFRPVNCAELAMPGAIITAKGARIISKATFIKIWERGIEDSQRQLDAFREKAREKEQRVRSSCQFCDPFSKIQEPCRRCR